MGSPVGFRWNDLACSSLFVPWGCCRGDTRGLCHGEHGAPCWEALYTEVLQRRKRLAGLVFGHGRGPCCTTASKRETVPSAADHRLWLWTQNSAGGTINHTELVYIVLHIYLMNLDFGRNARRRIRRAGNRRQAQLPPAGLPAVGPARAGNGRKRRAVPRAPNRQGRDLEGRGEIVSASNGRRASPIRDRIPHGDKAGAETRASIAFQRGCVVSYPLSTSVAGAYPPWQPQS